MKRIYSYLFCCLFFITCSESHKVPENVLQPDKMQAVLYDVFRADELMSIYISKDSSYRKPEKRAELYQSVFNAHKITKDYFKRSLNFYEGHPDLLNGMLDSLQKKANNPTILKEADPKKTPAV